MLGEVKLKKLKKVGEKILEALHKQEREKEEKKRRKEERRKENERRRKMMVK
jgi:hypothetical protein